MPRPLPIRPARRRFYGSLSVIELTQGAYIDGEWVDGLERRYAIQGSWQAPGALSEDIAGSGDVGLGSRRLWSRAFLPFYDIKSGAQTFIEEEGKRWRVTDRHSWGAISQGLYVYDCQRYHETKEEDEP